MISVVIPVRGESPPSPALLSRLETSPQVERIVATERSTPDATLRAWESAGARVLVSEAPRGRRLADAGREAAGDILLFLHADTLLPDGWTRLVEDAVSGGAVAGAFRLAFDGGGTRMEWVAFWANWRTRLTRVPYGDQAPFVRRDVYLRLGGHRPWPLMEDVDLGKRLRDEGRIALLPEAVLTSPRRYLERGVTRTILRNWRTLSRFRRGVSPEQLADEYRR